mmetsp:Transcript_86274/g.175284  ORF Transcript_86274/g.175284 Transcript_86274/m.175284 type:complete len:685 (+) Transcript_86274:229-2283(+)
MPRRNQNKKKNKRHRKGSYDRDPREDEDVVPMSTTTSLEEDLRQQRIRQREREQRLREREETNKDDDDDEGRCSNDVGFERQEEQPSVRFDNQRHAVEASGHLILKGSVLPASIAPRPRAAETKNTRSSPARTDPRAPPPPALPPTIRLPPSVLLRHIEESSPLLPVHKRCGLRKLWPAQHALESTTVSPRAASLYCKTKWPQHHTVEEHHPANLRCSWDLSCKHRLHPSARTFDVAVLGTGGGNREESPTIATIFQDGWGLLREKSRHKINTIKGPEAYSIRMHAESALCGMIVRPAGGGNNTGNDLVRSIRNRNHSSVLCHHTSSYSFRWYSLPHATSYVEASLPRPATDFCFGKDIALFACPRFSRASGESLNPLFLPLEYAGSNHGTDFSYFDTAVRSINVRNFPQSDALRIEMACEDQEKLVGFGHRNGQVSVLDLRASGTVCSILHCEEPAPSSLPSARGTKAHQPRLLGSVSDLGFLSGGHGVLVKRSFGSCQLHDLRKTASSPSPGSGFAAFRQPPNHNSATVLCNMGVPPGEIDPTLSAHCNGFSVDRHGGHTLLSPYVSRRSGDARLGVWSLHSGAMVGSRLLLANGGNDENNTTGGTNLSSTTLHAEVCSTHAPAFSRDGSNDDDNGASSHGVWLKCGAITNQTLRSRVGSLHQLTIPGRGWWEGHGTRDGIQ